MERWSPDTMLVPAVLAGRSTRMTELSMPDRCWLVAGLTMAGLTGDDIAERLHCCVRVVRKVLAEPATTLSMYVQHETATFSSEVQLARSEQRRLTAELQTAVVELERTRNRLRRATTPPGQSAPLCPKGEHPLTRYNAYMLKGRVYCRACHRDRQAAYRARKQTVGV